MSASFQASLRAAVMNGDGQAALAAIAGLPECYAISPRDLVRSGLETASGRGSFATLCIEQRRLAVLEHVVRQAPFGLTLDDFCTFSHFDSNGREFTQTLGSLALAAFQPDALELAFRLDPQSRDLTELFPFGGSKATLHFIALKRAAGNPRDNLQPHIACARVFKRHGATIARAGESAGAAVEAFFTYGWDVRNRNEVAGLLREYHAAGLVDVNARLPVTVDSVGGLFALGATIKNGDPLATRELLVLGADIGLPLSPTVPDLHALARSYGHGAASELAAAITEGVMVQRLRVPASSAAPGSRSRRSMAV